MKKNKKLALSAILAALTVVLLLLGSIITVLDLTTAALASIMIMVAVIEMGGAYPYLIWLSAGILAVLLVPDKFGAVIYLFFAGIYPILKARLERLPRFISWVLKFVCFNVMLTVGIFAMRFIMPTAEIGTSFTLTLYLLCNFTFFVYDLATTQLITLYVFKLRSQLRLHRFFK